MKRPLRPEERRLWAVVAATVRPAPGRARAAPDPVPKAGPDPAPARPAPVLEPPPPALRLTPFRVGELAGAKPPSTFRPSDPTPRGIEPNRLQRIVREREEIAGRLDLHGYDQDRARAALIDFVRRRHAEGARAVLIITGKGSRGEGVIRKRAPEWLGEPALREIVAGVAPAERRHGGEGALYVALKRLARD